MHRALVQPDILRCFILESDPKYYTNLIRVSRRFFDSAAPLIWRDIKGVHIILALLPKVDICVLFNQPKCFRIIFRDKWSSDRGRLNIYAPFVKTLEIYGDNIDSFEMYGWEHSLGWYNNKGPLLPNVTRLALTTSFTIDSDYHLLWMRAFVSPTTLDVHFPRNLLAGCEEFPLPSESDAVDIVKHVSNTVPTIQRLSLFVENWGESSDEGEYLTAALKLHPDLGRYLRRFTALRELTCTEAFLLPDILPLLARLPNLLALNVWAEGTAFQTHDIPEKCTVPNAFPVLERLSIRQAWALDIISILGTLAFRNVTTLVLGISEHIDEEHMEGCIQPWHYNLMMDIVAGCPRTKFLKIDFDENSRYRYPIVCDLIEDSNKPGHTNTLQMMSKLPLETVYIDSAILGDVCTSTESVRGEDLLIAWPRVTKLHLPRLLINFKNIYEFTRLPMLEELTVRLHFDEWSVEDHDLFERSSGPLGLSRLNGSGQTNPGEVEPEFTAEILVHIWPNIEHIGFYMDPEFPIDYEYSDVIEEMEDLDKELQKLRSASDSD